MQTKTIKDENWEVLLELQICKSFSFDHLAQLTITFHFGKHKIVSPGWLLRYRPSDDRFVLQTPVLHRFAEISLSGAYALYFNQEDFNQLRNAAVELFEATIPNWREKLYNEVVKSYKGK